MTLLLLSSSILCLPLSCSLLLRELFGSLLLAYMEKPVAEGFGVWFPRSICRIHQSWAGGHSGPLSPAQRGRGHEGGHNGGRTWGPMGEQQGAAPVPSFNIARGFTCGWGGLKRKVRESICEYVYISIYLSVFCVLFYMVALSYMIYLVILCLICSHAY